MGIIYNFCFAGLSTCKWPGRAQTIARKNVTYYLDGAHTKESMEVSLQT